MLWSVVLYVLLGCAVSALPGELSITQYGRDQWTRRNGLPAAGVFQLGQTKDDYLWARIPTGLVHFDGVRFVPVIPSRRGMSFDENVRSMQVDAKGRLLVRTMNHSLALGQDGFEPLAAAEHLPDGIDKLIFQASDGTVWIGSDNHLYRQGDSGIQRVMKGIGAVYCLFEDSSHRLWIGCSGGLYCLDREHLLAYPNKFNADMRRMDIPSTEVIPGAVCWTGDESSIVSILEDRAGVIHVASQLRLYRMEEGRPVLEESGAVFNYANINCMFLDRDGNLWVGTNREGLYRRSKDAWSSLKASDGLSSNDVLSLCEDREGSLWVGTRLGMDRLRSTPLLTTTVREGLSNDNLRSLVEAKEGGLWLFTAGSGLNHLKDGRVTQLCVKQGLQGDYGGTLFVDGDGVLWTGADRGLNRVDDRGVTVFTDNGALLKVFISAIGADEQGLLVAGSDLNIRRFKDGVFTPYDLKLTPGLTKFEHRYVYGMFCDENRDMWFGLSAGLYRVPRGASPLQAIASSFHDPVHVFHDDGRGFLWIWGPENPGITRFRKQDGQLIRYDVRTGLSMMQVSGIVSDGAGDLWLGTSRGILRLSRAELDAIAEGRASLINGRYFDAADGMLNEDAASGGSFPAACRTRDGKLHFATPMGLVSLDPERIPVNRELPKVHIEAFSVDHKPIAERGDLITLEPGSNTLEIQYTCTSLSVPERVRFRYQLQGSDDEWVDAGARRTAFYTHLSPGRYRFKVIACNNDGYWNEEGAGLEFLIPPRFYQTRLFYGLSVVAVGLCVLGIHQFRVRRLRRRERELVAVVEERTRTLQAEVAERRAAEAELQRYRTYLEQLVDERTAELRGSKQQLEEEVLERRKSEEQLRQAQKMEAVGQLAGGIAHDFNNLLTAIIGSTEILQTEELPREELQSLTGEIKDAAQRAAALTRQLLAFSRKQVLQPRLVNPASVIENMQKMLHRLLGEDVRLELSLATQKAWILADPGQLEQIILNLSINARDAMPRGGFLRISAADLPLGDPSGFPGIPCVHISVSDTGMGMSPEVQARIFEPFFTTKGVGHGTGLGLSTVYGIVNQSHGRIRVDSQQGRGTTFHLWFPVSSEQLPSSVAGSSQPKPALVQQGLILVVEDNELVLSIVRKTLQHQGFDVIEAVNGHEAQRLCDEVGDRLVLLLSDVILPDINGCEVVQQARARNPRLKVLLMSGYTDDAFTRFGGLLQDVPLLNKPFTQEELISRVREVLAG